MKPRIINPKTNTSSISKITHIEHKRLAPYSIIETTLIDQGNRTIVIGQNQSWLAKALFLFFSKPVQQLTLNEIKAFLCHLNNQFNKPTITSNIYRWFRDLRVRTPANKVLFLEDELLNPNTHDLILTIIGQYLIETFSKRKSSIHQVEVSRNQCQSRHWVLLIYSNTSSETVSFWDPNRLIPELDRLSFSKNQHMHTFVFNQYVHHLQVLNPSLTIHHPKEITEKDSNHLTLISNNGKKLEFKLEGRTTASKRFASEQKAIEYASASELVSIELGFHPFWFQFGHTTLRVGESLYELTSRGWKCHNSGSDKARAFIFNNPFFKSQLKKYQVRGMPPMSIGCNLSVSKQQVIDLLHYLDERVEADKEVFSLFTNNCNQGIMRALNHVGISGFTPRGYLGFSSILSFRKTLLDEREDVNELYIYPLPGSKYTHQKIRQWFPEYLYKHNTTGREIVRGWGLVYLRSGIFNTTQALNKLRAVLFKRQADVSSHELIEW